MKILVMGLPGSGKTTLLLNHLYLLCKEYNITPWFISQLSIIKLNYFLNLIPEDRWLVPKNLCLVNKAFNIDKPISSWRDPGLTQSEEYQKFIAPCENHPNIEGHQTIAELLLERLSIVE